MERIGFEMIITFIIFFQLCQQLHSDSTVYWPRNVISNNDYDYLTPGLYLRSSYWSAWTRYSKCTKTCGGGQRRRTRRCNIVDGKKCFGSDTQTEKCNIKNCPIDGEWGEWSVILHCTVTCGSGHQMQFRRCNNPTPQFNGQKCIGKEAKVVSCNQGGCPVNGSWSEWTDFGECSKTCDGGQRQRTRRCDNPAPEHGGKNCSGSDSESKKCNTKNCPIDGGWGEWMVNVFCSTTCGSGQQMRSRQCNNPTPQFNGQSCPIDNATKIETCNQGDCPEEKSQENF